MHNDILNSRINFKLCYMKRKRQQNTTQHMVGSWQHHTPIQRDNGGKRKGKRWWNTEWCSKTSNRTDNDGKRRKRKALWNTKNKERVRLRSQERRARMITKSTTHNPAQSLDCCAPTLLHKRPNNIHDNCIPWMTTYSKLVLVIEQWKLF